MIYKSGATDDQYLHTPAPGLGVINSWCPEEARGVGNTRGFEGLLLASRVWQRMQVRCRLGGVLR